MIEIMGSLCTYRPVVVEVAELVSEALDVIWLHARCVIDNVVVSWGYCSLTHTLAHQEEVKPVYKQEVILEMDALLFNTCCTLLWGEI